MKKSLILSLLAGALLGFTACSDDDNVENPSEKVQGTYSGYTVASSKYFSSQVAPDQTMTITAGTTVGEVAIAYTSDTWGKISISAATVSGSSESYTISGTGTSEMGMGGNTKEYTCTVAGTITSGVADLTFTCPQVMGGLNIVFCQGEIPAELVIPGNYTGYTQASSQYFQGMYSDDQTITIVADGTNWKVNMTSETWGEFEISGVTATRTETGFKLEGKGTCKMGMGGNIKDYDVDFSGSTDYAKENYSLKFSMPAVMGGMTIELLPGKAPQTEE